MARPNAADGRRQSHESMERLARHGLAMSGLGKAAGGKHKPTSESAKTLFAVALSVSSSVSIVVCNKYLISGLGFHQATSLTGMHTLACVLTMRLALGLGWMEYKDCPRQAILIFGVMQGISIGLLNLSLGFNSVGFYQMTKLAIIPCTVCVERIVYRKMFSLMTKASIAVLLLGVGVATVTDLQLNLKGSVLSLLAVVTTCLAQIWTGTTQKRHGLTSAQLLYHASPVMAGVLCSIGPFMDYILTGESLLSYNYSLPSVFFILLSCCIAVAVNLATFLVIGRCDAVTYQVLGHLKTVLVLGFGFVTLQSPASARNLTGISIAMVGMVGYGFFKDRQTRSGAPVLPKTSPVKGGRPEGAGYSGSALAGGSMTSRNSSVARRL
mmetsp:Transcript_47698/g.121708  ORF Transcript_47698/g.121708 Transcript_47698/m.121708 type:complete len:382 (-) Transcript_47698:24-1169(-)